MYFENIEQLQSYVEQLEVEENDQLMIMAGEKSSLFINQLISYLNSKGINFLEEFFLVFWLRQNIPNKDLLYINIALSLLLW